MQIYFRASKREGAGQKPRSVLSKTDPYFLWEVFDAPLFCPPFWEAGCFLRAGFFVATFAFPR